MSPSFLLNGFTTSPFNDFQEMNQFFHSKWSKNILIYFFSIIALLWAVGPIYWVVVSSISTRMELYSAPEKVWFPSEPTLEAYYRLFQGGGQYRGGGCPSLRACLCSALGSVGAALPVFGLGSSWFWVRGTAILWSSTSHLCNRLLTTSLPKQVYGYLAC